ncbi:MAG TPA: hypothetical protein VJ550_16060 [Geomonas sp.]|nr:hypothetical protein [Geomonas sp.]
MKKDAAPWQHGAGFDDLTIFIMKVKVIRPDCWRGFAAQITGQDDVIINFLGFAIEFTAPDVYNPPTPPSWPKCL